MTQQRRSVMTENTQIPAATNLNITNDSKNIAANGGEEGSFRNPQTEEIQKQSNAEDAKNPKVGSDYFAGGIGDLSETLGESTEGAYQQNGQSFQSFPHDQGGWLGGPQNGNE